MTWVPYTAWEPLHTTTTATTWAGWQPTSALCFGCIHAVIRFGRLACHCASRTLRHGPEGVTCMSYNGELARPYAAEIRELLEADGGQD